MGYINSYGQSIGPVKIENIWAGAVRSNKIYLGFAKDTWTLDQGDGNFAPLMAETPAGNAPKNAVATIEWVKQYATAGSSPLDLSQYATKTELANIRVTLDAVQTKTQEIENNIKDYSADIESLKNSQVSLVEAIANNRQNILKNSNAVSELQQAQSEITNSIELIKRTVDINSNNIANNSQAILQNTIDIAKNTEEIENIRDIVGDINESAGEAINKVEEMEQDVAALKTQVGMNTNNIFTINEKLVEVDQTLQNHQQFIDNPFANGLILVCGGAVLNAS